MGVLWHDLRTEKSRITDIEISFSRITKISKTRKSEGKNRGGVGASGTMRECIRGAVFTTPTVHLPFSFRPFLISQVIPKCT